MIQTVKLYHEITHIMQDKLESEIVSCVNSDLTTHKINKNGIPNCLFKPDHSFKEYHKEIENVFPDDIYNTYYICVNCGVRKIYTHRTTEDGTVLEYTEYNRVRALDKFLEFNQDF